MYIEKKKEKNRLTIKKNIAGLFCQGISIMVGNYHKIANGRKKKKSIKPLLYEDRVIFHNQDNTSKKILKFSGKLFTIVQIKILGGLKVWIGAPIPEVSASSLEKLLQYFNNFHMNILISKLPLKPKLRIMNYLSNAFVKDIHYMTNSNFTAEQLGYQTSKASIIFETTFYHAIT